MQSDAIVNGVLSFIIPGLGQAINGNRNRAIVMFIGMLIVQNYIFIFLNIDIMTVIS